MSIVWTIAAMASDTDLECLRSWQPPDVDGDIQYCVVPTKVTYLEEYKIAVACLIIVMIINISLAIIFSVKLKQVTCLVSMLCKYF